MAFSAQANEQFEEQRKIRREHKQTYQLMGGITLLVIGIWIGAQLFGGDAGFTTNLYTEALSIGVTILVLNWFADRRATRQRKEELFLQLGSQSNDFALEAKRQLKIEGWLEEALAQKKFPRANWQGMVLARMDLTHLTLLNANLVCTNLMSADLSNAVLCRSSLSNAFLVDTKLTNANLLDANLTGAVLWFADLTNANLSYANLTDASLLITDLANANFDVNTILPDGTHWTSDTDMSRFTDPTHPQFWGTEKLNTAAYGYGDE